MRSSFFDAVYSIGKSSRDIIYHTVEREPRVRIQILYVSTVYIYIYIYCQRSAIIQRIRKMIIEELQPHTILEIILEAKYTKQDAWSNRYCQNPTTLVISSKH